LNEAAARRWNFEFTGGPVSKDLFWFCFHGLNRLLKTRALFGQPRSLNDNHSPIQLYE